MIFGGAEVLVIGSTLKWGLDIYGNWKTAQTLVCGDPVKKQVEELLAAQKEQAAQLQQVNEQLLVVANLDGVHWEKKPANLPPDVEPSVEELAAIAQPVQTLVTGFNGGTPQPLLGSALIAIPPSFYLNPRTTENYCFIDYFIEDGDWPPARDDQVWVVHKNSYGRYHIGTINRSYLTKLGLGLHQHWQPNQRVLPAHLRVKEDAIRRIVGLAPLPQPKPPAPPVAAPKPPAPPVAAPVAADPVPTAGTAFSHKLKSGGQGPEMLMLAPGKFRMGGTKNDYEKPIHEVTIAKEFAMGKYQVTFDDYDAFCTATKRELPIDQGWGRGRRPVINVSWDDAVAYCTWLSGQTGHNYRLPSEAEWEYVCRAGTTTEYSFGDDEKQLGDYAWFDGNSGKQTHPVGEKKPNPWGLYDMHGNVWEWCQDYWYDNYQGAPNDENHVLRKVIRMPVPSVVGRGTTFLTGCVLLSATASSPHPSATTSWGFASSRTNFYRSHAPAWECSRGRSSVPKLANSDAKALVPSNNFHDLWSRPVDFRTLERPWLHSHAGSVGTIKFYKNFKYNLSRIIL